MQKQLQLAGQNREKAPGSRVCGRPEAGVLIPPWIVGFIGFLFGLVWFEIEGLPKGDLCWDCAG